MPLRFVGGIDTQYAVRRSGLVMVVATLDTFAKGVCGRVLSIAEDGESCCRLRRMGLREGVNVEIMSDQGHDPVMIRFEGCCLAVRRSMLRSVVVQQCANPNPTPTEENCARCGKPRRRWLRRGQA